MLSRPHSTTVPSTAASLARTPCFFCSLRRPYSPSQPSSPVVCAAWELSFTHTRYPLSPSSWARVCLKPPRRPSRLAVRLHTLGMYVASLIVKISILHNGPPDAQVQQLQPGAHLSTQAPPWHSWTRYFRTNPISPNLATRGAAHGTVVDLRMSLLLTPEVIDQVFSDDCRRRRAVPIPRRGMTSTTSFNYSALAEP